MISDTPRVDRRKHPDMDRTRDANENNLTTSWKNNKIAPTPDMPRYSLTNKVTRTDGAGIAPHSHNLPLIGCIEVKVRIDGFHKLSIAKAPQCQS